MLNNPLKYTDPTGHYECWDEDCNGGPSGGGGGGSSGGGGSGGTTNPCNDDPTAEGCPGAQEAVPPAETGEEQGTNKAGKCDVASADNGFGSDCGGNEEQQQKAVCEKKCNYENWKEYLGNAKNADLAWGGAIGVGGLVTCGATGIGCAVALVGAAVMFYGEAVPGYAEQVLGKCLNSPLCMEKAPQIDESPDLPPLLPLLHEYPAIAPSPLELRSFSNPIERFAPWRQLPLEAILNNILDGN